MTIQDNTFNADPSREKLSVQSAILLRKATLVNSVRRESEANNKMTIGHPDMVKQTVDGWAKNWSDRDDPLKFLSLVDTPLTSKEMAAINSIETDGNLQLEAIVAAPEQEEQASPVISRDEESQDIRIAQAVAAVANAFRAEPYQYLGTDPVAEQGITDLSVLTASNQEFGLAA